MGQKFWPMSDQMRKLLLLISLAVLLTGCAAPRQMTRDEWLSATQRTYPGKSPDEVFKAAEKLFRLADGADFQISYTEDTMTAVRPWSVYLVLAAAAGSDTWLLRATPSPDGTKASIGVSTTTGGMMAPMATTNGGASVATLPGYGGAAVQGTAIYDTFWARMDYLLGQTDHWMTCEESDGRVRTGQTWGLNEALCNSFNVEDEFPEELRGVLKKPKPSGNRVDFPFGTAPQ